MGKKHKQKMRIRKEPCPPPRHIIGCTFFVFFVSRGGRRKEKEKRKQSRAPHDMKLQTVTTKLTQRGRLVSFTKLHCRIHVVHSSFVCALVPLDDPLFCVIFVFFNNIMKVCLSLCNFMFQPTATNENFCVI